MMAGASAGTRALRMAAGGLSVLIAVAACGAASSNHPPSHMRGASQAHAAPLPQPSVRCGTPNKPALTLRFPAADGSPLEGAIVGHGAVGVVLLHEYPGPMCGWWPYANYLGARGFEALLFDFRCLGLEPCHAGWHADPVADVAGAVRVLRSRGARAIVLLGASLGGVVSVMAGGQLDPSAIVDLSGERSLPGLLPGVTLDSAAAAPALRAPALFVVARGDSNVSVAEMRSVYGRARSRIKRLLILPSSAGHGWDMLLGSGGGWAPLAHQIVEFIRARTENLSSGRPAEEAVDGCVRPGPRVNRIALRPVGEAPLPAILIGTGKTTVVLTNESDENLCGWLSFAGTLTRHGYSALLYDYRDPSRLASEATAGIAAARAAGARRVVLMGASVGARAALEAAALDPTGLDSVISLSAERTVSSDPSDLVKRLGRVTAPTLLISARQDPFVNGATQPLLRALGSRRNEVLIVSGVDHGTALLTGTNGPRVRSAILKFIASK